MTHDIQNSDRSRRRTSIAALLILIMLAVVSCQNIPVRVIKHARLDTDGRTRGVAAQDKYAFLAEGEGGLRIVNIYSPGALHQESVLALPGPCSALAVEGDIVVAADDSQNRIFVIDVFDKFKPALKWTIGTKDKVRAIALQGGFVFLAERGDNPSDPSYFSGAEAVSVSLKTAPGKLCETAIAGARDVAATTNSVLVIGAESLTILSRSSQGFGAAPAATLNLGSGADLQSVDVRAEGLALILGGSLYLVDISKASNPVVADQTTVPGFTQHRVISSTGALGTVAPGSSTPVFARFTYSTLHEYGVGLIEMNAKKIVFCIQAVDAYTLSDGHLEIHDIDMRGDFLTHYSGGEVLAVGALDDYGLGVAY